VIARCGVESAVHEAPQRRVTWSAWIRAMAWAAFDEDQLHVLGERRQLQGPAAEKPEDLDDNPE
jgi:hypothetical protein